MEKKIMIWIGIGAGSVLLLLAGWFGFRLWQGSREAGAAAQEFSVLLQEGELEKLELGCYAYDARDMEVLQDEEGQTQVVMVTPQQMAQRFGGSAEMAAENGEEASEERPEEIEKIIMSYSNVRVSVGMVWRSRTSMTMLLEGPDIQGWLENLSEDELFALLSAGDGYSGMVEAKLSGGEIPRRTVRMQIPMVKQDGRWRFQVTEEMEQAFYGAPYPAQ